MRTSAMLLTAVIGLAAWALCQDLPAEQLFKSGSKGSKESGKSAGDWCDDGSSCAPVWTISGSALFMQRGQPDNTVLALEVDGGGAPTGPALRGSDFDFDFEPGFEVSAIRHNECWPDVEVRFMMIDDWNATTAVAVNPANNIRINNTPPTFVVGPATQIAATYSSSLNSSELNLRRCLRGSLTGLAGFRYMEIDEQLGLAFPGTPALYGVNTRNRLYGGQAGLDWQRCWGRWDVNLFGKAGIYGNSAAQDTAAFTGAFTPTASAVDTSLAFVGELGIRGRASLTENWSLIAGYQLLWVEGVALASEQIAATNLVAMTGIDTSDGVFYHGATVGLEWLH